MRGISGKKVLSPPILQRRAKALEGVLLEHEPQNFAGLRPWKKHEERRPGNKLLMKSLMDSPRFGW